MGIGCDLVSHEMTENLNWGSDAIVLRRIFSLRELELYDIQKNLKFLSGRFAAKEAVVKCLGTGMADGIALNEIHILQSQLGKPEIELTGEVKKLAKQLGINFWQVSISHSTTHSVAFVIAEQREF